MNIIERILDLSKDYTLFRYQHIVQGVTIAIQEKEIFPGDQLPSINDLNKQLGYSSRTILRAYKTLQKEELIGSIKNKGYFVTHKDEITRKHS